MLNQHCSACGTVWPSGLGWPRTCASCGETTWSNPLPVAVLLVPVSYVDGRIGVIIERRDIEPFRGEPALPGGFIETGESWREAAVRELREETGLLASADEVELFDVHSSHNGQTLLVFGVVPPRPVEALPVSAPTAEATEWLVAMEPTPLCFPTHTRALADFFARGGGTYR